MSFIKPLFQQLKNVRYGEVILLLGSPFLGVFLSLNSWSDFDLYSFILFCFATFILIAHVYTFNDWAGYNTEVACQQDTRLINPKLTLFLSVVFAVLSVLLYLKISLSNFFIAGALIGLSFLYSDPHLKFKSVPVVSSLIHILGGTLLFLSGYFVFDSFSVKGLLLGFYFALVFCGGHLTHEIIHFSNDLVSGLKTNAIKFGKVKSFMASFIIFSLSSVYLVILITRGLFPFSLIYVIALVYILYVYLFLLTFRKGLNWQALIMFRRGYRILYVGLGIYMWLVLIWGMPK